MDEGITEEQKNRILHKEIDLVEDAISRMAKNAFLIKGWCLSVLAFVFALAGKFSVGKLSFLLLVPVISFWWLDSYYLRLERLFRKRYEDVIRKRTLEHVWTDLYSMNLKPYLQNVQGEIRIMFSSSEFPFYGVFPAFPFFDLSARKFVFMRDVSKFAFPALCGENFSVFKNAHACGIIAAVFQL